MTTATSVPVAAGRRGSAGLDAFARFLAASVLAGFLLPVYWQSLLGHSAFLPFALIGASVFHLRQRPRTLEISMTAILAIALGIWVTLRTGAHWDAYIGERMVAYGSFAGFASFAVMAARATLDTGSLPSFLLAAVAPLSMVVVNLGLGMSIWLEPRVYDQNLYRFDGALGFQASFMLGRWMVAWPALRSVCFLVYSSIPLMAVIAHVIARRGPVRLFTLFVVAGVAGFLLYHICPGAGPAYLFPKDFPFAAPALDRAGAIDLSGPPRNAMPSLHAAWLLLIVWNTWSCRRFRPIALLFALLTVMATMGLGEHYLIDLVVAVPFTLAVQAGLLRRLTPALWGAGMTLAWLAFLRIGTPPNSPRLAWPAVLATLALCAVIARRVRVPSYASVRS